MTLSRYLPACDLYEAAGHSTVPVKISEIRAMATKIGRATVKTDKAGKTTVKPVDTAPPVAKAARRAKADRTEKALKANVERATITNTGMHKISTSGGDVVHPGETKKVSFKANAARGKRT